MTGRTCPVHGEYSASGVCRWCETEPISTPMADVPALLRQCNTRELARVCNVDKTPPLNGKIILDMMLEWEARLAASRFSYDVMMVKHWHSELAVVEQSCLDDRHAALRWERVARRWNYKHCEPRWINEEWRAYVWRCWLEQMALRREGNLIAAGIPKEWP